MNIKLIKSEENYIATLKQIESLMDSKPNTLQIHELEDIEDLKLLKATREEEILSFEEYLKNEN